MWQRCSSKDIKKNKNTSHTLGETTGKTAYLVKSSCSGHTEKSHNSIRRDITE